MCFLFSIRPPPPLDFVLAVLQVALALLAALTRESSLAAFLYDILIME
jgi:hypothetical protein